MSNNNADLVGRFVLIDGRIWKITGTFQNCLTEKPEYECRRTNKRTRQAENRMFHVGDKSVAGIYKTRERAEIARLNQRITELEQELEAFEETMDQVREVYHLY